MFSANKKNEPSQGQAQNGGARLQPTVIARGVRLEGEFVSQGDVTIEGEVVGRVKTSGLLTVGPEAQLKAEVAARDAVVSGKIEGNLTVERRLDLKASAQLDGDLVCQSASVEAGARLNGRVTMSAPTQEKRDAEGV
jgi:cytoskeletal protein CcmA (bactofilin family)